MPNGARTLVMLGAAIAAAGCNPSGRVNTAELALAAAASESLTVALADSLDPSGGYLVSQAGQQIESLSACHDPVDARGWESVASNMIEMQLPPGFRSASVGQTARWTGPAGWIAASPGSRSSYSNLGGAVTSECDIFISGAPTHVQLVTTTYGRGVYASIRPQDAPAIEISAMARNIDGQAQLLHAIRYASISSAWGRPYQLQDRK